jgi:hypothetical protein
MKKITKDNLFAPKPSRSESKSAITDKTARAITDRESSERQRKTESLRAARLEREKGEPEKFVSGTPSKKKAKPIMKKGG